jgi:hypothetical protein
MRICGAGFGLSILIGLCTFFLQSSKGQSPAPNPAAATTLRISANLSQLMKGILFPNSNVIFAAQSDNPADVKPDARPSTATNPLAGPFGKWEAVENSALAIAESANLLTISGRKCSNGRDVPVKNADWLKFVQELHDAGMTAYKAAQSKNQDDIVTAAEAVTMACSNCHEKYRRADRCK